MELFLKIVSPIQSYDFQTFSHNLLLTLPASTLIGVILFFVLGAFVGLIITNCIVMGRLEAYAMGNKPYDSVLDAFGNAIGYGWIIITVAFFRELLGSGSVLGFKVFEFIGWENFPTNGLMVDSVGAFIIIGLIIWIQRSISGYVEN